MDEFVKQLRDYEESGLSSISPYEAGEIADAIEELSRDLDSMNEANIALYGALPHWIPVTEALPEKNQIVVVVQHGKTWDYGQFRGLAYLGGNIHKWNWKNNTTKTVDYWMPKKSALPEPPKEE